MKPLIISQPWGGLGDNLQYSRIPELAKRYNIPCYISKYNIYRNEDIRKLIKLGFEETEEEGDNFGVSYEPITDHICLNWQLLFLRRYNLLENYKVEEYKTLINNKYYISNLPTVFYKPKLINCPEYLFDPNSIHHQYSPITVGNTISLNDKSNPNSIITKDIFDYIDYVYSAKVFYCLFSGSSVVGAAVREKNTICFLPKGTTTEQFKSYYWFPNIRYII